jgi:hypothetical protein
LVVEAAAFRDKMVVQAVLAAAVEQVLKIQKMAQF